MFVIAAPERVTLFDEDMASSPWNILITCRQRARQHEDQFILNRRTPFCQQKSNLELRKNSDRLHGASGGSAAFAFDSRRGRAVAERFLTYRGATTGFRIGWQSPDFRALDARPLVSLTPKPTALGTRLAELYPDTVRPRDGTVEALHELKRLVWRQCRPLRRFLLRLGKPPGLRTQ